MLLLSKKNRSAINEVKFMVQSNSCKKKRNPARQLKVLSLFTGYHDNKKYAIASEKYLSVIIVSIEDIVSQTLDIGLIVMNISVI